MRTLNAWNAHKLEQPNDHLESKGAIAEVELVRRILSIPMDNLTLQNQYKPKKLSLLELKEF